ncbi:MAG: PAS domain S-box protein, partial [Desulfobacterales bacterium]|nr:PAS domain S-box protein [Desulfobacterales bacterium]
WGAGAPENYLYKAQLVEAELLSVKGRPREAHKLYQAAMENARKAGNRLDLGIACECMGRHLERIGLEDASKEYIRRSVRVFHNWGARNKSNRLSKEYDIAIREEIVSPESDAPRRSTCIVDDKLDLEALVGTIESLTGDLKFDSLLATLLDAVMRRSGATRVVYIHVEGARMGVGAEKRGRGAVKLFDAKDAAPASFGLPVATLEKCCSGPGEPALENMEIEKETPGEEGRESRWKSVLIIPLMRRRSVKGLVYLENDLMEDAFREDQVRFLTLLAGQAAIAMENARIFEHLNAERDYSSNIIKNGPGLICGIDGAGITTFINPVVEEVTGHREDELIGANWWELLYPGDEYTQVDRLFKALEKGELADYEMTLTRANGARRDVVWSSLTRRDKNNNILEIIGFGADVTERKKSEERLRSSERRIAQIIDFLPDPTFVIDNDGKVIFWNRAISELTGVSADAMLGRGDYEYALPFYNERRPVMIDLVKNWNEETAREYLYVKQKGDALISETRNLLFRTGVSFFLNAAGPLYDDDGRMIGAIETIREITERRVTEQSLRENEALLSNIVDAMPSALVGVDDQVRVTLWNKQAERITGRTFQQAGARPLETVYPQLADEMERIREAIANRRVLTDSKRERRHKDETR